MPETVNTFVKSLSGMVGQPKTSDVKQQTDWNADYRSEQVTRGSGAQRPQAAPTLPRLHLSPSEPDRMLLGSPQGVSGHRHTLRQDSHILRCRDRNRRYARLVQVFEMISIQMRTGPSPKDIMSLQLRAHRLFGQPIIIALTGQSSLSSGKPCFRGRFQISSR
jgi:hypothetical protein